MESLIQRHRRPLLRFLYGYVQDTDVAEELFSDVFLALYFKRGFTPRENATLKSYLYKIARNKALNALKKRKRRREFSLERLLEKGDAWQGESLSPTLFAPSTPLCLDPHAHVEQTEKRQSIARALRNLKPAYRETLLLRYYDNLSPKEIAAVTGKTEKQVYNLLQRGKAALKTYFLGERYENQLAKHRSHEPQLYENRQTARPRRPRKNQTYKTKT